MRTFPIALRPNHSRSSPLDIAVHPPNSREIHYPYVPDDIPCDVTRMDGEMTYDRDPDGLVDIGSFDPRADAFPTQDGFRGSAPRDWDGGGLCAGATYLSCRQVRLGTGRLGSGADLEPVPRSSAGVGHCQSVRDPRPGRGFEHLGPRGSDACWPHRRGGGDQLDPSCAPASRYIGFVGRCSIADASRAKGVTRDPAGTTAQFRGPAAWLRAFKPPHACDRLVPARDSVLPTRYGRSPDRLSPTGRNYLGGHSVAWLGCVSRAGSKTK